MLNALIFDVDGTLAETEEVHRAAFNRTFAEFGLDWSWDRALYGELLKVTGGKERMRMGGPDGKIGHAEIEIGDSVVMLADEFPDMGVRSAKTIGGSPVLVVLYVDDVDATFAAAVDAGATVLEELEDKFYGDRAGQIEDPFGHRWSLMTHIEDVSEEEMQRRAAEQAAQG